MTDVRECDPNLPDDVQALIGTLQYEEVGEFPVERGYFWTSAASVENGNPIFWDDAVADEITDGPVGPLMLLSAWFRPHHWAPGRTEAALPLIPVQAVGILRSARSGLHVPIDPALPQLQPRSPAAGLAPGSAACPGD